MSSKDVEKPKDQSGVSRRDFIKSVGIGGGGVVVGTALAASTSAVLEAKEKTSKPKILGPNKAPLTLSYLYTNGVVNSCSNRPGNGHHGIFTHAARTAKTSA